MCACMRACVCACVCVHVHVRVHVRTYMCAYVLQTYQIMEVTLYLANNTQDIIYSTCVRIHILYCIYIQYSIFNANTTAVAIT